MPKKEIIFPASGRRPRGPFVPATRFGDLVFISGQAVLNYDTGRGEGDLVQQTQVVMDRIKGVAEAAGSSMADLLETNCWLTDISNFPAFNDTYGKCFSNEPPARTTVQGAPANPDQHVEVAAIAGVAGRNQRKALNPDNLFRPVPPFSHSTIFGDLVFVAGQSAYDPRIHGATGTLEEQVRTTLDRIKLIVEASGSSMENVLDCTCYLRNREDFWTFNEIYASDFPGNRPTRATLGMIQPANNGLFEMECIACMNSAPKEVVQVSNVPAPTPPFNLCTRVGNLVFVAGLATREPAGDVRGQTRVVLDRMKLILESAGASMDNILNTTCWLTNRTDFAAFNEAYRAAISEPNHARATVEAQLMAPEALIEIGAIACIPD